MGQGAEMAMPIINPASVGRERIVTNINIGITIAVQIAKRDRQTLVTRNFGQRFSVFINESSVQPRHRGEVPFAIIQVKDIGFAQFKHSIAYELDPLRVTTSGCGFAVYISERKGAAGPDDGIYPVIGYVQVQGSVAVNVS